MLLMMCKPQKDPHYTNLSSLSLQETALTVGSYKLEERAPSVGRI